MNVLYISFPANDLTDMSIQQSLLFICLHKFFATIIHARITKRYKYFYMHIEMCMPSPYTHHKLTIHGYTSTIPSTIYVHYIHGNIICVITWCHLKLRLSHCVQSIKKETAAAQPVMDVWVKYPRSPFQFEKIAAKTIYVEYTKIWFYFLFISEIFNAISKTGKTLNGTQKNKFSILKHSDKEFIQKKSNLKLNYIFINCFFFVVK